MGVAGRHAVRILRERGPRELAVRVLAATVYRRLVLLRAETVGDAVEPPPIPGMTVELLERTELEEYLALRPDVSMETIKARIDGGERCLVTRLDGELLRALWIARGFAVSPYLRCKLPLAADEVYIHDLFAAPRGRGVKHAPTVQAVLAGRMAAEGHRALLALVQPENHYAMEAVIKSGFRPVEVVATLTIGSRLWVFRRRLPRALRGS